LRSWRLADARWASEADLRLPLWREHRASWGEAYLRGAVPVAPGPYASRVACSLDGLRELLAATDHRVAVTFEVGTGGLPHAALREVEELVGSPLPQLPAGALGSPHTRTLGLTLDATDSRRSVAILVPHWESWQFLEPCVEAITAQRHPALDQRVYVLDDCSSDGSFERASEAYAGRDDVRVLRIERPNRATVADVGLLLDLGLREVEEQYVAAIDADLFPLSPDWLAFPVWLIEQLGLSMVGLDTGLSSAYANRSPGRWWQPEDGYLTAAGVYDNDWFVCINNLYRVMPTALAKVASEQVGFARRTDPIPFARKLVRRLGASRIRLGSTDGYIQHDADNGVAANHFVDVNRLGPKFNIPITSYLGLTPEDGAFGQHICGLAFHFALSTRALSRERREVAEPGAEYTRWAERLSVAGGVTRETLAEMIEASRVFRAGGEDGSIPVSWFEGELAYVESLLERYRAATGAS
jgi:glycosyltransferase involved in cell wall biosynthesis